MNWDQRGERLSCMWVTDCRGNRSAHSKEPFKPLVASLSFKGKVHRKIHLPVFLVSHRWLTIPLTLVRLYNNTETTFAIGNHKVAASPCKFTALLHFFQELYSMASEEGGRGLRWGWAWSLRCSAPEEMTNLPSVRKQFTRDNSVKSCLMPHIFWGEEGREAHEEETILLWSFHKLAASSDLWPLISTRPPHLSPPAGLSAHTNGQHDNELIT